MNETGVQNYRARLHLSLDRWALGPSKLPSYECHGGLDELHEDGKSRRRLPTKKWAPKLAAGSGGMVSVCSSRIYNSVRIENAVAVSSCTLKTT